MVEKKKKKKKDFLLNFVNSIKLFLFNLYNWHDVGRPNFVELLAFYDGETVIMGGKTSVTILRLQNSISRPSSSPVLRSANYLLSTVTAMDTRDLS